MGHTHLAHVLRSVTIFIIIVVIIIVIIIIIIIIIIITIIQAPRHISARHGMAWHSIA